jgi:hypothetical protein
MFSQRCLLLFCVVILFTACGGQRPSPKTAQSVSRSFFTSYGHKYKATPFAQKNIDKVEINQIEPVSYRVALVDAFVGFKDGHVGRTLVKMENKFPYGWRILSWEMLDYQ